MSDTLRSIMYVVVALVLSSCNNDIFVDKDETAVNLYGIVEGDNDSITFKIPTDKLLSITIDNLYSSQFSYYNSKGEKVDADSPYPQIALIDYDTPWLAYQIRIEGKTVTLISRYNCRDIDVNLQLRLDYTYASRIIQVVISKGASAELVNIEYNDDISVLETRQENRSLIYANNSDIATSANINPYLGYSIKYIVEPADSWAYNKPIDIRVPEYNDGEWTLGSEIQLNLAQTATKNIPYNGEYIKVELEPGKSARIVSTVTLEMVATTGSISYRNPISGKVFTTDFTTKAMVPIDYDVNVAYN